jgi:hypothetical protein
VGVSAVFSQEFEIQSYFQRFLVNYQGNKSIHINFIFIGYPIMSIYSSVLAIMLIALLFPSNDGYQNVFPRKATSSLKQSYFDDISIFKTNEKKCLIGFTMDSWYIVTHATD